jgi:hypothetical protein
LVCQPPASAAPMPWFNMLLALAEGQRIVSESLEVMLTVIA